MRYFMTQNLPEKQTQNNQIVEKSRNEGLIPHEPEGGTYKVSGKDAPTSKQVQLWANEQAISVKILEVGKNDEMAWARMQAINNETGQTVEDEVILRYEDIQERKMIDLVDKSIKNAPRNAKKTPLIKDLSNPLLVNEEGKVVANLTPRGIIHMKKQMVNFKYTAERTAQTMATRRVQDKILNREWRTKEERQAEEEERNMVQESIENEKRPPVKETPDPQNEKSDLQDEKQEKEKQQKREKKESKTTKQKTATDDENGVKRIRTFTKKPQEQMKKKSEKPETKTKTEEHPHQEEQTQQVKTEVQGNEIIDQSKWDELQKLNPMALVDRLIAIYKDTGKKPTKSMIQKNLDHLQDQKMIDSPKHMICTDYLKELKL